MKKRRIVFVVLYAVLIFINTIPIFIYRDKVQTAFSWLFLAVMLLELIYGIFCCVCKHKANFFEIIAESICSGKMTNPLLRQNISGSLIAMQ